MKPKILSVTYMDDAEKQVVLLCTDGPRVSKALAPADALQFWKAHGVDTEGWLPAAQLLPTPDRAEVEALRAELTLALAANKRALENANAQCAAKHKALKEVTALQGIIGELRRDLESCERGRHEAQVRATKAEEEVKRRDGISTAIHAKLRKEEEAHRNTIKLVHAHDHVTITQLRTELVLLHTEATNLRKRNATQEETIKTMQVEIAELKEECDPLSAQDRALKDSIMGLVEQRNQLQGEVAKWLLALDQSNAQLASIKAIICK